VFTAVSSIVCVPTAATGDSVSSFPPNRRVGFRVRDDVTEVVLETGAAEGAAVLVVIAEGAPVGETVGVTGVGGLVGDAVGETAGDAEVGSLIGDAVVGVDCIPGVLLGIRCREC